MTGPAELLASFRPDPDALISTLLRMGGDGAIATIAAADGGWGQEGTADMLRGLRERGVLEPGIDSQDLENLTLASPRDARSRCGNVCAVRCPTS